MSAKTRKEVLARLRRNYAKARRSEEKTVLLDEACRVLGYHRKAAIRALNEKKEKPKAKAAPAVFGRPREYEASKLLPVLKTIWLCAQQPCGRRLAALMADWVPAYEAEDRRLESGVREALLRASPATLDRLLQGVRVQGGATGTRPGSLLRKQIPIAGKVWDQSEAGYLEVDTVAMCGGLLQGTHVWMLDATDYATAWVEVRAQWNRGQHATVCSLEDVRQRLPFELRGLDADNGSEFLNGHVLAWCGERRPRVDLTRSRAYHKNDNAHIEQKNWTHVRQWFGYERYDNLEVVELINELTRGALGQLQNYFLPNLKLLSKERDEKGRMVRRYGPAQTPLERVLASEQVSAAKKAELRKKKAKLNPFALQRQIEKELRVIEAKRRAKC